MVSIVRWTNWRHAGGNVRVIVTSASWVSDRHEYRTLVPLRMGMVEVGCQTEEDSPPNRAMGSLDE